MAALPNLLTVEEFRELPESGEYVYELHHGEVVAMTRPRAGHWLVQLRLVELLQPKVAAFGKVGPECAYRAIPQFDLRAADVAVISHERVRSLDRDDNLIGAPELVIEVISASNRKARLQETVSLCLNHGALECWLVDRNKQSVTVVRKDGTTTAYGGDDRIPLTAFGSDHLRAADIFA